MRRTKEEAEATKKSILEAARSLFIQKGFSQTTLDDIAATAGFTRGAVHWHFRNKFGLLVALQEMERSPMEQLIGKLTIDESLDPIDALHSTMQTFFHELNRNPDKRQLFQVMFREMHNSKLNPGFARTQQFDAEVRTILCNIFKLAERRGILAAPWAPASGALALQTMVKGLITCWLHETASPAFMDQGMLAVRHFLTSLRKE